MVSDAEDDELVDLREREKLFPDFDWEPRILNADKKHFADKATKTRCDHVSHMDIQMGMV